MSMPLAVHLTATAALLLGACSTSLAPVEVATGCPDQPLRGPETDEDLPIELLIDDFENAVPALPRIGGRDGTWNMGKDDTGTVQASESSSACAARGLRAGHFSGKDFTVWGANWTAVMRPTTSDGKATPYDASAYSGFSFWAATKPEDSPVKVPIGATTMDDAFNSDICTNCMDIYHQEVTLTSRWQKITLRFQDLQQYGYGEPQIALRPDQLVGFIIWPIKGSFDLWIDDLRFEP